MVVTPAVLIKKTFVISRGYYADVGGIKNKERLPGFSERVSYAYMKGSAVRPAAKGYDIAAQINEGGGYIPGYEIFFYFITDKAFGNEPQFNPGFGVGKADFISTKR